MDEYILIKTMDGENHRFRKVNTVNYWLFEDGEIIEKMMEKNIFTIELETRTVYFHSKNVIKIELVKAV